MALSPLTDGWKSHRRAILMKKRLAGFCRLTRRAGLTAGHGREYQPALLGQQPLLRLELPVMQQPRSKPWVAPAGTVGRAGLIGNSHDGAMPQVGRKVRLSWKSVYVVRTEGSIDGFKYLAASAVFLPHQAFTLPSTKHPVLPLLRINK